MKNTTDINPFAGKLEKAYSVTCANCTIWHMPSPAFNRRVSEQSLRRDGWIMQKGLWYCHDCAEKEQTS